jgi:hypothetical protein
VLTKIDEILAWEARVEHERESRFVELGRYLCEVRAGQYWRLDNLNSFDEFLEKRFPESRRKAYYLMGIHEHLPKQTRKHLKQVGWTKAAELNRHLTGKETEPWEIIYFKLYKNQLPVVEQALETAALMLGTDKSRGYCLEMICADFLGGVNLENQNSTALLFSISRLFQFLPREQRQQFLHQATVAS